MQWFATTRNTCYIETVQFLTGVTNEADAMKSFVAVSSKKSSHAGELAAQVPKCEALCLKPHIAIYRKHISAVWQDDSARHDYEAGLGKLPAVENMYLSFCTAVSSAR